VATAKVSLGEVRSELVTLRTLRGGISQDGVMTHAPRIQRLPVVAAEMTRCGLVDRGVAAYGVIACAVQRGVRHTTLRTILLWTLNLERQDVPVLKNRRAKAQLAVKSTSEKTYLREEEKAYLELASLLLRLKRSPCDGDDGRDELGQRLRDLELTDAVASIQLDVPLQPIVAMLLERIETADLFQAADLIAELLDELPHAQPFLSQRESRWQYVDLCNAAYVIADVEGWTTPFDDLERWSDERVRVTLGHSYGRTWGLDQPVGSFERFLLGLERLAEFICRVERGDRWGDVLPSASDA
jgi:hypothetical protein